MSESASGPTIFPRSDEVQPVKVGSKSESEDKIASYLDNGSISGSYRVNK